MLIEGDKLGRRREKNQVILGPAGRAWGFFLQVGHVCRRPIVVWVGLLAKKADNWELLADGSGIGDALGQGCAFAVSNCGLVNILPVL